MDVGTDGEGEMEGRTDGGGADRQRERWTEGRMDGGGGRQTEGERDGRTDRGTDG